jgi:hypothetical protein
LAWEAKHGTPELDYSQVDTSRWSKKDRLAWEAKHAKVLPPVEPVVACAVEPPPPVVMELPPPVVVQDPAVALAEQLRDAADQFRDRPAVRELIGKRFKGDLGRGYDEEITIADVSLQGIEAHVHIAFNGGDRGTYDYPVWGFDEHFGHMIEVGTEARSSESEPINLRSPKRESNASLYGARTLAEILDRSLVARSRSDGFLDRLQAGRDLRGAHRRRRGDQGLERIA